MQHGYKKEQKGQKCSNRIWQVSFSGAALRWSTCKTVVLLGFYWFLHMEVVLITVLVIWLFKFAYYRSGKTQSAVFCNAKKKLWMTDNYCSLWVISSAQEPERTTGTCLFVFTNIIELLLFHLKFAPKSKMAEVKNKKPQWCQSHGSFMSHGLHHDAWQDNNRRTKHKTSQNVKLHENSERLAGKVILYECGSASFKNRVSAGSSAHKDLFLTLQQVVLTGN